MWSQLGRWGSANTVLWKRWTTLEEMAADRQGASLQSWWLHSCWWSYWWTQRSSCPCGRCCPQPRLHPVLWLLHSRGHRETQTKHTRRSMSEHFQCRVFHRCATALMFSSHFSWSCTGQGRQTCSCPAALAPTPSPAVPDKAQKFPPLCTDSCPLCLSTLFWPFLTFLTDLWMLFDK